MAVSYLQYTFATLYGRLLSHAIDGTPTADEITEAKTTVNDGYLRFLMEDDWSFAVKSTTLSVTATNNGVESLPTDFDHFITDPIVTTYQGIQRLEWRSPEWIRERWYATSSATGYCQFYALEPVAFVASSGERWQILLYPLPSANQTLSYTYRQMGAAMSMGGR